MSCPNFLPNTPYLKTKSMRMKNHTTACVCMAKKYSTSWTHNLSSFIKLVTSSLILEATLLLMVDIVGTLACIFDLIYIFRVLEYEKVHR